MSAGAIMALATVAGLMLMVAGGSVLFWMAPPGAPDSVTAARLAEGSSANIVCTHRAG